MRKIILLCIFLQLLTGKLFSQEQYFSLGGHLFAGEYPINNPVSTGDTGIVYLYQLSNKSIIPADTVQFSNLGYFVFLNVPEGEYLLKAGLTKNSKHYFDFFPTYFHSDLRWNFSNSVTLKDSSMFEANIRLIPTQTILLGTASIRGYVVQSADEDGFKKIRDTEVLLLDENLDPVTFCLSDANGSFIFSGLPFGTYHLLVESTGMFSVLQKITLDKDHSDYENIVLEVLAHQPAGIKETLESPGTTISQVFPNPAEEYIRSVIRTLEPMDVEVVIYSITGIKIISYNYQVTGIRSLQIPVGELAKGTYLLMIRSSGTPFYKVQKFVKL
jgi:hypothetical protein